MKSTITIIAIIAAVPFGAQAFIPSNFKKCNRHNPDFKKCLVDAVEDAMSQLKKPIKELNLPSLEPFIVEALTVHGGRRVVAVDQYFTNCKFFGVTQTKIEKWDLDFDKKSLEVLAIIPELTAKCEYELDGNILVLVIKGKGNSTITLKNLRITFDNGRYKEYKKHNKTYTKVEDGDLYCKAEGVQFYFDNLFNGNEELGHHVNQVLNENSLDIFEEMIPDYSELVKKILISLYNHVFQRVSMEEAFD